MNQMDEIIRTEGLIKRYRGKDSVVTAVNHVTISIPRGKMTVLRGKSGSGKTTLINLMSALDLPDEGGIFFEGEDITKFSAARRDNLRRDKMGFIFQSVALIGEMTALENVEFALRISGVAASRRKSRALECLERVGLANRAKHMTQELSGGEQQRVAIARAISHCPAVIFADEPTAQLDTQTGMQVLKLFFELIETEGFTMVMTTHDPEIYEIAQILYTLKDGGISDEL